MRKIAIINQKGGTGKTTTAANLGVGLARKGKKVILIDTDPQGSLGVWFNVPEGKTLYHVLTNGFGLEGCIYPIMDNLDLIPSNRSLVQAEILLAGRPQRESVLKESLSKIADYDYAILDCAPSLSLLSLNSLIYASEVFIPVSMEYLSMVGAKELLENLKMARELLSHEIKVTMVIPTFYDKRNRKSSEVVSNLDKYFPGLVSSPIRISVRLSESVSYHRDIFSYAPQSSGAEDYEKLVKRVINE